MDEVKVKLDLFLKEIEALGFEMKVDMIFKAAILEGMSEREKTLTATLARLYFDPVVQFVDKNPKAEENTEAPSEPTPEPVTPEVVA